MNMPESVENLWGSFLDPRPSPLLELLREQGALLKQGTNGVLEGHTSVQGQQAWVDVAFFIVAPPINNYLYLLFTVHHGATPFPARVVKEADDGGDRVIECQNIGEFKDTVRAILQSPRVREVVSGLLATASAGLVATLPDYAGGVGDGD